MASSRKGKISELYDLAAIEKQQETVIKLVGDLVTTINNVKPVAVNLSGAEKTKEIIDGMKKVSEATQQVGETSKTAVNEMGKLVDMSKKAANSYEQQANLITKFAGTLDQNIKLQTQYKIRLDEISKAIKDQKSAYEQGLSSADQYAAKLANLTKEQTELKTAASEVGQTIKAQVKEAQAAEGGYDQLNQRLGLLRDAYRQLSAEEKKGGAGQALLSQITSLDAALKDQDASMGNFQRNVGNYTGSVNILRKSLADVEAELNRMNQAGNSNSEEVQKLQGEQALLTQVLNKNVQGFASLTMEVRANERALAGMFQQGLQNTEAYKSLETEISNAKRELGEFKEQQKILSSQTPGIAAATLAAKGLAGAYAVGAGAAALFADGDEKVQKELQKLVAIMTVLQGLQQVHELLEKKGTIATVARAAAEKIKSFVLTGSTQGLAVNTVVQEGNTVATASGAVATRALSGAMIGLRVALIATGIGALLILLPSIAAAMGKTADNTKRMGAETKEAGMDMQVLADSMDNAKDAYVNAIKSLDEVRTALDYAKEGIISKQKAVDIYNESIGKTMGQVKTFTEVEDKLSDPVRVKAYVDMMLYKAAANYALEEASKKAYQAELNHTKSLEKAQDIKKKGEAEKDKAAGAGGLSEFLSSGIKNEAEKTKEEADNSVKAIENVAENFQNKVKEIAKKFKFDPTDSQGDGKGKGDKDKNKELEKDLQARFDLYKLEKQREIDLQKIDANDKNNPFASRYNALLSALDKEEQLITAQRDFDLKKQKLTENERKLIIGKAEDDILKLRTDAAGKLIEIQKDGKDKLHDILSQRTKLNQDEASRQIDVLTDGLQKQTDEIQKAGDKQLALDLNRYSAGEINKEEYERRKLAIENQVRKESLLAEIDYYDKLLKIANVAPDKAAEAEKKLAALRKELNALDVKNTEDANAKKEASDKAYHDALRDRLIELGNQIKETVFALLESGIDRQKNAIQDQINLVDERTKKEIEAVEQTTLSEQDKAAKVTIINARAQAQKEALERRQRQLDEQKARFDKAKSIVDIIQNTTIAVIKTLAAYPGPPGIILAAIIGAIGAAQLVKVLATPIPHYAEGTDAHEGGYAVVGDGGKVEYVQTPDGNIHETPATDTLVNMPKGSKVFKDQFALMNAMANRSITTSLQLKERPNDHYQFQNMTTQLGGKLDRVERAIKNIPQPVFDRSGLKQVIHSNGSVEQYIKGL